MLQRYESSSDYKAIECHHGKDISFISKQTATNLALIYGKMVFIPVTTRSLEQYQRLTLFRECLIPRYAVISNGGIILKNGEPIEEWSLMMKEQLKSIASLDFMLKRIEQLPFYKMMSRVETIDHLFISFTIQDDRDNTLDISQLLDSEIEDFGWKVAVSDRKVYLIPRPINKWKAIRFLQKKLQFDSIFSAGDSSLDLEMLLHSNYSVAPAHGSVLTDHPAILSTTQFGMKASEEITRMVLDNHLSLYSIKD